MSLSNKVFIIGNIGKDAEIHFTEGGTAVCKFSVATEHRYKKDGQDYSEGTIWWNCNLWGKGGEALSKYLTKGTKVYVDGRAKQREYDGKIFTDIQVSDINILSSSDRRNEAAPEQPKKARSQEVKETRQSYGGNFNDSANPPRYVPSTELPNLDDIPF